MKKLTRRDFIKTSSVCLGGLAASSLVGRRSLAAPLVKAPYLKNPKFQKKVIVLGFDGMDPNLVERFVAQGAMPTFKRLIETGKFGKLATTNPPQSPVAWSSFITGTNPGGTGIFDFIHRDPKAFTPYMSTSRSYDPEKSVKLGNWKVPLSSGRVDLMRKGTAFWSILEENGIPATLFQIPANFPITSKNVKAISGMGTPDLLGSYGTFTYFTDTKEFDRETFYGGRVVKVTPKDHKVETVLTGPENSLRADKSFAKVPISITRDPLEQTMKISIDGHDLIMRQGEWSDWIPLSFELMPLFAGVAGMVRFYAKEIHPNFKLYASPINIDPMDPSMPICSPAGYSRELSQAVGRFYTQGFPADTKSLITGVLSDDEYLTQAKIVFDENLKAFDYQFSKFNDGFFFFYFSCTDQNSHMMWRTMDPSHPLYKPNASPDVKDGLMYFYQRMDEVTKRALTKVDQNTTLLIVSDHGFAPFPREVHLSTWLVENGFTAVNDPDKMATADFYSCVDWKRTKAYALGLNGIYLNLKGREKYGSLDPDKAPKVKQELIAKLSQLRDPKSGQLVCSRVFDGSEIYSGPFVGLAPDIVVGYASGFRISDESVLGKFPTGSVGDRTNPWAADHCMDPAVVPGILLSNKGWDKNDPALWDMAPTILNAFGLPAPEVMEGETIYKA